MQSVAFAQLGNEHFERAYDIVVRATEWLNAKGVRQWDKPVPVETYQERHDAGLNHGYFVGDELVAVMTLKRDVPSYWQGVREFEEPFRWLSTFAIDRARAGSGLGPAALRAAEDYLRERGVPRIYLDCVDREGALPRFYSGAGYTMLERREWPDWTMCMFEKGLGRDGSTSQIADAV